MKSTRSTPEVTIAKKRKGRRVVQLSCQRCLSFAEALEVSERQYKTRCENILQLEVNFSWPDIVPCLSCIFQDLQTRECTDSEAWRRFLNSMTEEHIKDLMVVAQLFLLEEARMLPTLLKVPTSMDLGFILGCYDRRLNTPPILKTRRNKISPNILVFLETTVDDMPCSLLKVRQSSHGTQPEQLTVEVDGCWKRFAKKVYYLELKLEMAQYLFNIGPAQIKVVLSAKLWKGKDRKLLSQILESWFNTGSYFLGRHLIVLYEIYQRGSFLLTGY